MPLLNTTKLKTATPLLNKLHTHYNIGCEGNKKHIVMHFRGPQFLKQDDGVFFVSYSDLYDLFNYNALDICLMRVFAL